METGLAGSIISGLAFIVSSVMLYKLTLLITKSRLAGFVTFLVFALNLNILYMQATPMTELPLIAFFMLSTYFFIRYLKNEHDMSAII